MRTKCPSRRKGLALIMALVALAVVTVLITVITSQVVAQRNLVRQRQRQLQAEWLTRAGVEWAAAHLLQSGEPFTDGAPEIAPDSKVRVVVEKNGDVYAVTVEAEVGVAEPRGVKRDVIRQFRRSEKDGIVRIEAMR